MAPLKSKKAVLMSLIMSNGAMAFDGVSVRDPQSIWESERAITNG